MSELARAVAEELAVGDMSVFKAKPPSGLEPLSATSDGPSVFELIREDIIEGRLKANERLVVSDLAQRHGTSTNPVRRRCSSKLASSKTSSAVTIRWVNCAWALP